MSIAYVIVKTPHDELLFVALHLHMGVTSSHL
jgi:hypothetical protein